MQNVWLQCFFKDVKKGKDLGWRQGDCISTVMLTGRRLGPSAPAWGLQGELGGAFLHQEEFLPDPTSYDLPNKCYLNVFETSLVLTNLQSLLLLYF